MQTQASEEQIRQYAYQLWESEGKPDGQAEKHWCDACDHFKQGKQQQQQGKNTKKVTQQQA